MPEASAVRRIFQVLAYSSGLIPKALSDILGDVEVAHVVTAIAKTAICMEWAPVYQCL